MTLRHLQIFLEVAKCGNMTTAAKNLYISQPTVSQAIAEIENEYHTRLFSRLSKRLYITISGEQLLDYANRILELYNEMDQTMHFGQIVRLRLGFSLSVSSHMCSTIMSSYQSNHPEVETRVLTAHTTEIVDRLLHGKLDIALVSGQIQHSELVSEPVIFEPMVLVCRPDHLFSDADTVTAQMLHRVPMILRDEESDARSSFERFMRSQGFQVNCVWSSNNMDIIKSTVLDGYGVTVISPCLVRQELEAGLLRARRIEHFDDPYVFSLAYHKNKRLFPYFVGFGEVCRAYGTPLECFDPQES